MKFDSLKSRIRGFGIGNLLLGTFMMYLSCGSTARYVEISGSPLTVKAIRPPIDHDLRWLIPTTVDGAIRIDMEGLRKSALQPLLPIAVKTIIASGVPARTASRIAREAQEILSVAKCSSTQPVTQMTAIRGTDGFAADIVDSLRHSNTSAPFEIQNHRGVLLNQLAFLPVTQRTILIGTPALIQDAVLLEMRDDDYATTAWLQEDAFFREGFATARFRPETGTVDTCMAAKAKPSSRGHEIQSLNAALYRDSGIRLRSELAFRSSDSAVAAQRQMQRELRSFLAAPLLRLFRIGWVANRIQMRTHEHQLFVDVSFTEQDMSRLNSIIEPILQIQSLFSGGE